MVDLHMLISCRPGSIRRTDSFGKCCWGDSLPNVVQQGLRVSNNDGMCKDSNPVRSGIASRAVLLIISFTKQARLAPIKLQKVNILQIVSGLRFDFERLPIIIDDTHTYTHSLGRAKKTKKLSCHQLLGQQAASNEYMIYVLLEIDSAHAIRVFANCYYNH